MGYVCFFGMKMYEVIGTSKAAFIWILDSYSFMLTI